MWRRTMLLFCLIAALSGTPLRQAEAASDFARTHAEQGEDHVRTIDGGVGDDAELAVLKNAGEASRAQAMVPRAPAERLIPQLLLNIFTPEYGPRSQSDAALMTPSPGSAGCHAWLQRFLC